jgi:DNA-directed RNA polymerase specialized sigma subunit, sigma24 homolog
MARTKKAGLGAEFKHGTSIGANGELLYDCPIEIKDKADLDNYSITTEDCRYLHFGSSEKILVFFFKTPNRALAEAQWEHINSQHSAGYFSVRCMVPGKRKAFVRCRDTNKCSACPYGRTPETKQIPVVSWDGLLDTGWEPAPAESVEHRVIAKMEYQAIRALMDAEDKRIFQAHEMKTLQGYSVAEIAEELGVSQPRVYQLLARGKEIGREYRAKNG